MVKEAEQGVGADGHKPLSCGRGGGLGGVLGGVPGCRYLLIVFSICAHGWICFVQ